MASDSIPEYKTILQKLRNNSDSDLDPYLEQLLSLLKLLSETSASSTSQKDQVLQELPSCISSLQTRTKLAPSSLALIELILTSVMTQIHSLSSHSKYLETFRICIDLDKPLYQSVGLDPRSGSWNPLSMEAPAWKASLKVNTLVDAVKIDPKFDRRCWARALIVFIDADFNLLLQLEDEGKEYDRLVHFSSHEVQKLGSRSQNEAWRDKLTSGGLVDCFDNTKVWYNSTIFDKRLVQNSHNTYTTEVLVGFRVYESHGEKSDEKGKFRGWSSKYDEWISVKSPRIAPFGLHGRMWMNSQQNSNEEFLIDDSNDMLETTADTFCVTRERKCSSCVLINSLNSFGKSGGFDFMLRVLKDTEKWPNFEQIYTFAYVLGKISPILHKRFAMNYVIQFKDAVFSCLYAAPLNNYRDYSKEKLDLIFESIETMLKRVLTVPQKNSTVDSFLMSFYLKNLSTQYLERRIYGVKGIMDSANKTNFLKSRGMKSSELIRWIRNNDILAQLFGANTHAQLVQRTAEVLKLLASENNLTSEDVELLWTASQRNNGDMRKAVYSVINEVCASLKPEIIEIFVRKISELPPAKLQTEEVNLIYELTKFTVRAGNASVRACEFFHFVVLNSEGYSENIKSACMESYCNLLKSWEKAKMRPNVMVQCVENIREGRSTLMAIRIIEKLLAIFPIAFSSKDTPTRNSMSQFLINERGVITALFDNIKHFKDTNSMDSLTSNYTEEIAARLNFLKTLIGESFVIRVTERQLNLLWELLHEKAYSEGEQKAFIKWLCEVTESQVSGKRIFEDHDLQKFFSERIADPDKDFTKLSIDEFLVFKNLFICVNISTNKMKRLYSNLSQSSSEPAPDFDYGVLVAPVALEGMTSLRKIIITSTDYKICAEAAELLYELYNHAMDVDRRAINQELISHLLSILKSEGLQGQRRSLEVMKRFIEESEKDGTGKLVPHSALLKGDQLIVVIINNITYHPHNPEIAKRLEVRISSNQTLWQLRCKVGKVVKCLYDQFKVIRTSSNIEIKERENGKTLQELRFRSGESLSLYRKNVNKAKVPLLTGDNQFTPRAESIFRKLFYKFAEDGEKMGAEGCAAFTNSCTGDPFKATDKKISDFLSLYDDDNDGFLTVDNFLTFYKTSYINKPHVVWNNLISHHYRQDLRRYDDSDDDGQLDCSELPASILIEDTSNFDLIFDLLNDKGLETEAWELILKLPTSPSILSTISSSSDWSRLFTDSSHKILYILRIIQYFMQSSSGGQNHRQWKIDFIKSKGLEYLFSLLNSLKASTDTVGKVCMASVLKIVSVFILAAFSAQKPEIFETIARVRKESANFEEVEGEEKKKVEEDEEGQDNQFAWLVQDIVQEGLAESIVQVVDFKELVISLMVMMENTVHKGNYEIEDKQIVDSALELWISCILDKSELLKCVIGSESIDFEDFLLSSLTRPTFVALRKSFCQAYYSICLKLESENPTPYFLNILIAAIQSSREFLECGQLYELIASLVVLDKPSPTQDYQHLAQFLCRRMFEIPCNEKKGASSADKMLIGLIKLSDVIFQSFPEVKTQLVGPEFVGRFYKEMLFSDDLTFENAKFAPDDTSSTQQILNPKAKARETRNTAYNLLLTIQHSNEAISNLLINSLNELKTRLKPITSWTYSPSNESRSLHGYVGITNIGCICYMNSILQQFFTIPDVRYSILSANDQIPDTNSPVPPDFLSKNRGEGRIDDNLLHQLQFLFGFLELSDRQAYNPWPFCYSFKDLNGLPVNTAVQQDSQEFLNMLLERLDKLLLNTCYKSLLQSTFGGKISNQVICNECKSLTETSENFYSMSLDVKNSKTIQESFSKLISGDVISDYHCETCSKKVDITRRTVVDKLPNVLILHLQRIVFDFDTFTNQKINSRLEFPLELDILPYTKVGVTGGSEDSRYELRGIVVHIGHADYGHYISYIKDNKRWLEFDDSSIKSFNPQNIEVECFGKSTDADPSSMFDQNKCKNAYMLFYEKIQKSAALEGDSTTSSRPITNDPACRTLPDEVYQAILKDNQRFQLEKSVYCSDFFEYFLSAAKLSVKFFDVSKICIHYMLDLISHTTYNKSLPSLVALVKDCYSAYPGAEVYFLDLITQDNFETVNKYLLQCPEKIIRENFAVLVADTLLHSVGKDLSISSTVSMIIDYLLSLIPQEISKNAIRFEQYWQLFALISESELIGVYLLKRKSLANFIDFYLCECSPLAKLSEERTPIGNKLWTPCFGFLVTTVRNFYRLIVKDLYFLDENDEKCLNHAEFYAKSIRNDYDCDSLSEILSALSRDNEEFSYAIAEALILGLNEVDINGISSYYRIIYTFLGIDDKHAGNAYLECRLQWILGIPSPISGRDIEKRRFGSSHINFIEDEVFNYPTTLYFDPSDPKHSILTLIWNHKKQWDHSCLSSIKHLLQICIEYPKVFQYISQMPPPAYQFSSYFHWMQVFIQNSRPIKPTGCKKDILYSENLILLEELKAEETESYIIGETLKEIKLIAEEKDLVSVEVTAFECKYFKSAPNGKINLALPELDPSIVHKPDRTEAHPQAEIIMRFEAVNNTSDPVLIELQFDPEASNFYKPLSTIKVQVSNKSSKNFLTIFKKKPSEDWGNMEFKWSARRFHPVVVVKKEEDYSENLDFFGLDELGISANDFEAEIISAPSGQFSCPKCTFFNDVGKTTCIMCTHVFTKK